MKKNLTKLTAVLAAAIMTASLFAGCGSSSASSTAASAEEAAPAAASAVSEEAAAPAADGDFSPKAYTLALPFMESGYTPFVTFRTNCDRIEELTNGTIINDARSLTPDDVLSFVEAQCAAGVDGLIITPPSDSILPTVTQLCEEAGVYWAISLRSIADPEIKALVEASPYYVGNCYEDEETAGYTCGKFMGEQGFKKVALFSQTKGDTTTDTREVGFAKAAEEYGIEIVGESRGNTQASDITSATQSFLAANPDLDAIFYAGTSVSGAQEACIKAIQDAGRDEVKFVGVDFPEEMIADFETGINVYNYAQISLSFDCYIAMMKVINAIQGYPISNDGAPTSNHMYMVGVDSAEAAEKYSAISGNTEYMFFSDDDITNKLLKWNNTSLDEAGLQEIVDNYVINE